MKKTSPVSARAFTLIELLVVITIAGILVSILILNFNGVREKQQLAFLADKSLAMMTQAQAEVRAGKISEDAAAGEESAYLCEGAFFEVGAVPVFVSGPYESEDDGAGGEDGAGGCKTDEFTEEIYGISSGGAVVGGITVGDVSEDAVYSIFSHPDGALKFYTAEGQELTGNGVIRFENGGEEFGMALNLNYMTGVVTLAANLDNEE
ncbi:MAG: type II secretion system protein [Candidatus Gracilibacteria bacterium]